MKESWGTSEFKDCGVSDKREAKRVAAMADKLLEHPELAFSSAVGAALRKAAWRIFSKEEVDLSGGHYGQTALRSQAHQRVLVRQDTSDLSFTTHQGTAGLGDLGAGNGGVNLGLCLHSALVLTPEGLPLGLVGQKVWAPVATGKGSHDRKAPLAQKESYRWLEALQWVEQYLAQVEQVLVISASESDFYEYLSAPRSANVELLLRVLHRYVYYQQERVELGSVNFTHTCARSLYLPKTKQRQARTAQLQVSWGKIVWSARHPFERRRRAFRTGPGHRTPSAYRRAAYCLVPAPYFARERRSYGSAAARLLPQTLDH